MNCGVMKTTTAVLAAFLVSATAALAAEIPSFSVQVSGQGRPMILIPGLACPGEVWDGTVAHFRDRFECHVVTLAGFGGAPARADASKPFLATAREELAQYIQAQALDHPVIVGHSLGGFLALDLAAQHPGLPGELVIVDSLPFLMGIMNPSATIEDAKHAAAATVSSYAQMDAAAYGRMVREGPNGSTMATREADIENVIRWGLASDAATVATAMTELYESDLRPELARIKSRTLTLAAWAGYAPYSNHAFIDQVYHAQYATLPDFHLAITDTARHFIMLDEPEWLFAQIEGFLTATNP